MVIALFLFGVLSAAIFLVFLVFLAMGRNEIEKQKALVVAILASFSWVVAPVICFWVTVLILEEKSALTRRMLGGIVGTFAGHFILLSVALSIFSLFAVWINFRAGKYDLVLKRAMLPFVGFIPAFILSAIMIFINY